MKERTAFHQDFKVRSCPSAPYYKVYLSLNADALDVSEDETAMSIMLTKDETLVLISDLKNAIGAEE